MSGADRLIILGTGGIAARHAEKFGEIESIEIVAAVDMNCERARTFADQHGIPHSFGSLAEAIDWGGFDAAVNSTPDAVHKATTLELLAAGKHVFCEKPLAPTYEDAMVMTDAAEKAGVVNMVNLTYRNAHAIQRARQMVEAGEIGSIRHVDANYLQSWLTGKHWGDWRTEERWLWRLSGSHGSKGVLGDIGIHLIDFVTFGSGLEIAALQARMKTFDKAQGGAIGPYRFDVNDSVAMTVELANGALGVVHMSRYATGNLNDLHLTIYGDRGALRVWANQFDSSLDVCLGANIDTATWERVACNPTPRNERRFAEALRAGVTGDPSFRRAAEVQKTLDLCFVSDAEKRMVATGLGSEIPIEAHDLTQRRAS
ncbi:trehalose utilization-related protein [Fulvimarina pelagi HTCC2506]|uniref:Trehalose utilization-related protein n=1 Tax=Fulvimarina pelagi HTCC2506 TaxID=314231 RepID=Q0G3Z1_9HYPH|nr:Gfo/Idh/MocA family oxidoreductase [Fulvimarina pelagi]EAU41690.1 trehalose utilization-related protein [Fulvimarina pelagi HTCC2506]